MKPGDPTYQVGLIAFSDKARIAFPFNAAEPWDVLINRVPHQKGTRSRVDQALQLARDELFTRRLGARADARKVVVIQRKKYSKYS